VEKMGSNSKNRIAILNNYERLSPRISHELQALSRAGYSAEVYNWVGKKEDLCTISDQNNIRVHSILLKRPKGKLRIIIYLPILYYKLLKQLQRRKVDIVHCTHLYLLPLALILRALKKTRVVYDAYEMYACDFGAYIPRFSKYISKFTELVENALAFKVDLILTVDSSKGFLEKRYRRFNPSVQVIYNVPNINFKCDHKRIEAIKKSYQDRKVIVNMGRLTAEKGLIKLLQATKEIKRKYPEVLLLLMGDLWLAKSAFEEFLFTNGLEKNVEVKKWLPYNDMMHYLKCADVACALYQPTLRHYHLVSRGNGRKIFTYMQACLPIVAPDFGGIARVVTEEKCGILVDSTNHQKIADAILCLFDNPDKARMLGENGNRAIVEKYNWESEKKKLLRAYSTMAEVGNSL